jgi:AraC-like DNA-binding protein
MDVLSDVLRSVKMTGAFFFEATNYAPWVCGEPTAAEIGKRLMPQSDLVIPLHVVTHGACWLETIGANAVTLRLVKGDIVVLPRGEAHFMMSTPGMRKYIDPAEFDPAPGRGQSLCYIVNGDKGGPVDCQFICGFMGCDYSPFNPLLEALPAVFRARTSDVNRDWLTNLALAGLGESERDGEGAEAMMARLAELMFVEVIRQRISEITPDDRGWLAGLRDSQVGAALGLIHANPSREWTLERLADAVGLSRSVFAERFAEKVGLPAITYLTRWRLTLASRLLNDNQLSIAQAGAEVGYESEAAFNRAFKKHVGVAPGAWRRGRQATN